VAARYLVYNKESYQRTVSNFERAKARRDKIVSSLSASESSTPATQNATTPSSSSGLPNKKGKKASQKSSGGGGLSSQQKKIDKAEEDVAVASTDVAARHSVPGFGRSVLFLILFRVMGAKYAGQAVAVLPFVPISFFRKFTKRGLPEEFPDNCCSILFVYMMCTLSVRVLAGQIFTVHPPSGVRSTSFMDTAKAQKLMKSFGVEEELKEARKMFSS